MQIMHDPRKPHAGIHPRVFAIVAKGRKDARQMRAFWTAMRSASRR